MEHELSIERRTRGIMGGSQALTKRDESWVNVYRHKVNPKKNRVEERVNMINMIFRPRIYWNLELRRRDIKLYRSQIGFFFYGINNY